MNAIKPLRYYRCLYGSYDKIPDNLFFAALVNDWTGRAKGDGGKVAKSRNPNSQFNINPQATKEYREYAKV